MNSIDRPRATVALALALAAAVPAAVAYDELPGPPQPHPVLLRGGIVHTISGDVLDGADVLFDHGRIVSVGPDLAAPAAADVVDVAGRHVYPGLIAAQTVIGLVEIGAVHATDDRAEVGEVTPEVSAAIAWDPDSELIPTIRNHGIALAQVIPGGGPIAGRSFLTRLDGWTREDAGVREIDGLEVVWPDLRVRPARTEDEEQAERRRERIDERRARLRHAFRDARAYDRARSADPATPIDLRWEAMRPAVAGTQNVYIRADDARQIDEALDLTEEYGLRAVIVGAAEAELVADRLGDLDVPVIVGSTMALPYRADRPYDERFRVPAVLHDAGVRFCIAHITWGPWDVRNLPLQAGQAVAFGLPHDIAERAITLSAAEILGIAGDYGSLEPGKSATLFVSDGDVLDVLTQHVTRMWIDGRAVDLDDRQKALERKFRQRLADPAAAAVSSD